MSAAPKTVRGIRRDRYGWRAYVKVSNIQRERRFPPDTPLSTMKRWRDEIRVELRKRAPRRDIRGLLGSDVRRYLPLVQTMPTYAQRRDHLASWVQALGDTTPRSYVTAEQINAVLEQWRADGLGPATVNKRRAALMHLWSKLDGRGAANPVRSSRKYRPPDPLPRGRDPHVLDKKLKAMPSCRTRARLRVMLWTGMRPVEVMRAEPDDVHLQDRYVVVRTAKGGKPRTVPLTADGVSAWREFDRLDAWGSFTLAPAGRMLKDATGLPDLRVYDLRHSYGTALATRATRLDVIGALMGHSTLELTKRYTLAAVNEDALGATKKLAVAAGSRGKS